MDPTGTGTGKETADSSARTGGAKAVLSIVAAGALLGGGVFALSQVGLASAEPKDKIDICHRTSATNNPYTTQQVDTSSADLNGHNVHTGPVFDPENPQSEWGDIIPPFDRPTGDPYPGYNWPAGEAFLMNGCKIPDVSPSPTETSSPSPTETSSPSPTETSSPSPTETSSPSPTETSSPSPTETSSPSPTGTSTPTPTPVTTPTPTTATTPPPVAISVPEPGETATAIEESPTVPPVAIVAPELGTAPAATPAPVSAPQPGTLPSGVPAGGGGEAGR